MASIRQKCAGKCCPCGNGCLCESISFTAELIPSVVACDGAVDAAMQPRGSVTYWISLGWGAPPAALTAMLGPGESLRYEIWLHLPQDTRSINGVACGAITEPTAGYPPDLDDCSTATLWHGYDNPVETAPGIPNVEHPLTPKPLIERQQFEGRPGWAGYGDPQAWCVAGSRPGNVTLIAKAKAGSTTRELARCTVCIHGGDECYQVGCCPLDTPTAVSVTLESANFSAGPFVLTRDTLNGCPRYIGDADIPCDTGTKPAIIAVQFGRTAFPHFQGNWFYQVSSSTESGGLTENWQGFYSAPLQFIGGCYVHGGAAPQPIPQGGYYISSPNVTAVLNTIADPIDCFGGEEVTIQVVSIE